MSFILAQADGSNTNILIAVIAALGLPQFMDGVLKLIERRGASASELEHTKETAKSAERVDVLATLDKVVTSAMNNQAAMSQMAADAAASKRSSEQNAVLISQLMTVTLAIKDAVGTGIAPTVPFTEPIPVDNGLGPVTWGGDSE